MTGRLLLLFVSLCFLLRIALLADLLVLGRFDAALMSACFARFLCVIAATGLQIGRADCERKSASDESNQLGDLHVSSFVGGSHPFPK